MANDLPGVGPGGAQPIQVDPDALMQAATYISGVADAVRAERAKVQQSHDIAVQGWVEPISRNAYEHWHGTADEQLGQRENELRELAAHLAQTAQSFRQADAADTGGHGVSAGGASLVTGTGGTSGGIPAGAPPGWTRTDPDPPSPFDAPGTPRPITFDRPGLDTSFNPDTGELSIDMLYQGMAPLRHMGSLVDWLGSDVTSVSGHITDGLLQSVNDPTFASKLEAIVNRDLGPRGFTGSIRTVTTPNGAVQIWLRYTR